MTIQSGGSARELCVAADEALTQAWFCTGEFTEAERLFSDAAAAAARDGDMAVLARAASGLSQTWHGRNVATLVAGGVPTEADISAEEDLAGRALGLWRETGDSAGTGRALFDMSLVFQVLRHDWDTSMRYLWQAVGLAEALAESGDLYGCSEVHRHLGFYYLLEDIRPPEAVRQFGHSLALRERIGDARVIPSALAVLGEAEIAAGNPGRAVELLSRAVNVARQASLLPWRVQDAEETLRKAQGAVNSS